jgi:hypothetical protein
LQLEPPQPTQWLVPSQLSPPEHKLPAQQNSPELPQWQMPLEHDRPLAHGLAPPQHGSPAVPHAVQLPLAHTSELPLHMLPAQHGCVEAPQLTQLTP